MQCHVVPLQFGAVPPPVAIYHSSARTDEDEPGEPEAKEEDREPSPKFPEVCCPVFLPPVESPAERLQEPPVETPRGDEIRSGLFWQGAVRQLYKVYLQGRWNEVSRSLLSLHVSHWRQLLDFAGDLRSFVFTWNHSKAPPAVPVELLQFLAQVLLLRTEPSSPGRVSESFPLPYMHMALLARQLCLPSPGRQKPNAASVPKCVQFAVRLSGAQSVADLFKQYGAEAPEGGYWERCDTAWQQCGQRILEDSQDLLAELYPHRVSDLLSETLLEATEVTQRLPSLPNVLAAAALQFAIQNLGLPSRERNGYSSKTKDAQALYDCPEPDRGGWCLSGAEGVLFAHVLQACFALDPQPTASDRFLLCLMDILKLEKFRSATSEVAEDVALRDVLEIRTFSRLLRVLLQAYFIDPALLAARAASEAAPGAATAAPSDPEELVPVMQSGPLRRSIAFMEQSPLLQVVQRRLCSTTFEDVEGSTEQLTKFALRELRVLWFDLRRSTCTLKRSDSEAFLLLMKPLKLQLSCDCLAELATFPYMTLAASAQVTVRGLVISIAASWRLQGWELEDVAVNVPELEIKLGEATLLSRIAVSAILSIFQSTLQEHLQLQLKRILWRLLEREVNRWNSSSWSFLQRMVPEDLLLDAMQWLHENIPPEGLPI